MFRNLLLALLVVFPLATYAQPINVALLSGAGDGAWDTEVQAKLTAFGGGDFSTIDIIRIDAGTPTLGTLQSYDAVLVYTDVGAADPTALGNVLADYVDAGGGVVMAVFTIGGITIAGRFLTDGYFCIFDLSQSQDVQLTLGTIHEPTSPLLHNVASFDGGTSSYHSAATDVEPGCTRVADWSDGHPLLATTTIGGTLRADLNFYPPSDDSRADFWDATTDGDQLMRNALLYTAGAVVPVELVSFNAVVNGTDVSLNWATASETNNAGFEVQVQNGEDWNVLGFVEGHGTTTEAQTYGYTVGDMAVGTHTFRLKQIDFDGAFEYSDELEVTVETPGTHLITRAYPNPFNPQSRFTLAVAQEQHVTAELYNTLGRRVAVLFNGTVEANQSQLVTIDGADLASGTYIVRLNGERFSDALRVTLLK